MKGWVFLLADYANIIVLFVIIGLGFFLTHIHIFTKDTQRSFSKFIMQVSLLAEIFLRITREFSKNELLGMFTEIILPLLSISLLFLIGFFISKLLRVPATRLGLFSLDFATSSTAFLGIPIAMTVFGDRGVPYSLIYYVSNSLFFWTLGFFLVNKDAAYATGKKEQLSFKQFFKNIVNPVIIGFICALILVLLDIQLPTIAQTFFNYIGSMTTPTAMLYIGIVICTTGLQNIKLSKDVWGVLLGRYLFAPIVILLLAHFLNISSLMTKVSFVLAVLPVANGSVILAGEKNADIDFATSTVLFTTLFYLLYLPVVLYVIHSLV